MTLDWAEAAARQFDPPPDVFDLLEYEPTAKQAEFHAAAEYDVLYGGAAGGGKSKALLMHAMREAVHYPGLRVAAFRRSYDELRESLLKELAAVAFGEALHCSWNGTERELRFPNGSVIRFRYLETVVDATRRQGGEYQLVILDERTLIPPDAVSIVVDERIRSGDPRVPILGVRSGTNPGGPGHAQVKLRYIAGTDHGRRVYVDDQGRTVRFIQSKVDDNPHVDPGYLRRLDGIPDPARRAAMRDGDWDSFAGMAFPEWRDDAIVVPEFEIADSWPRYVGIDYGYAAPWAVVFLARDGDGRMWAYDELVDTRVTERDQARRILAAEERHLPGGRFARAADPAMWARAGSALPVATQYELEGVALAKADNDRLNGKARVHTYLADGPACAHHREQGRATCPMLHVTGARRLASTMASLPVDPRRPEDVDTHADDHCYDALRYALMHVGTAPSFVFDDEDPAELEHAPHDTWTERPDPHLPDWGADRDERAGGLTRSPYV